MDQGSGGLACEKCGGRNVTIVSRRRLREMSQERGGAFVPVCGALSPKDLLPLLKPILEIIGRVVDWLLKEREDYRYCEDCGYTAKMD